jgi:hypothetical protein
MPRKSPAEVLQHIQKYVRAWERHAPDVVFWNMTLAQFKARVRRSEETRKEILEVTARLRSLTSERNSADIDSLRLCEGVADGVRGNPTVASDSLMYEALGFVRKSVKRKRGKMRR